MRRVQMLLLAVLLLSPAVAAQEPSRLTRDEVAATKKKLVAVLEAMGQPPAGYVIEHEDFNLPTDVSTDRSSRKFRLIYPSAQRRFGGGAEKVRQKSQEELASEYEKKMAEAMAKGDFMAMQQLSQDLQKKAGEAQLKEIQARKQPIELQIQLNGGTLQTIDPDLILFEKPGVIALKDKGRREEKARIAVYFDPVSLKSTKQLSVVEFKEPQGGVDNKGVVLYITVQLSGPTSDVEAWAKRINTAAVLAQIGSGR